MLSAKIMHRQFSTHFYTLRTQYISIFLAQTLINATVDSDAKDNYSTTSLGDLTKWKQ